MTRPVPCRYCGAVIAQDDQGQFFATSPEIYDPWTCKPKESQSAGHRHEPEIDEVLTQIAEEAERTKDEPVKLYRHRVPEPHDVKQVIVIRRDLNMRRGKEIAQGAHAATAWLAGRMHRIPGEVAKAGMFSTAELTWLNSGSRKITCQVPGETEILALKAKADELGIEAHVITDAGTTEFGGVPTITAIAIGPDWDEWVDKVTGNLALY